ncbi:YigZ family protein [Paraneptunicella aestuarii]|uniref:YigZ family protein n=1 Tax=Paraneptunicella aestuarii TaxID=2831148 RepID=UPI001E3266B5|nr:YigZ family protein [Paraneptunicella aestuarii]UAA39403.1 YigZ family protein [Paraneptunicella aestuarii]
MSDSPYLIPAESLIFEEEIKKSRFITYLAHTPGVDAAKQFIEEMKEKHKDARHNCWAYVAAKPNDSTFWGCSDDGEPSGTAGRPMLAQLSGSGIGEISAVVTRYFGGVKLGTGGLVKAYGGGVKQALELLQTTEKIPQQEMLIRCDYDHVSLVEHLCQEFSADILDRQYTDHIEISVSLDSRQANEFQQLLTNRSSGTVECILPD